MSFRGANIIVDGGNFYYREDDDRARRLASYGIHYLDCGTSGGVWDLERGHRLMLGGEPGIVRHLDPIFATLAPSMGLLAPAPEREKRLGTAQQGYLHCSPKGVGHFVKMVHNGIEYSTMAAYAVGLNVLKNADAGKNQRVTDAETSPLRNPEYFQCALNLADIAEVWRRGSYRRSGLQKKFSALHAMARRGSLNFPVVGVAKSGWDVEKLRARTRDRIQTHGGVDEKAFEEAGRLTLEIGGLAHAAELRGDCKCFKLTAKSFFLSMWTTRC